MSLDCSILTPKNKNFTLFIMGFTIPEIKTPVPPPNAGNEVGMLNFISWGSKFIKINPPQKIHRIFMI